jgi:peptide alpha-N-acetyltransferase
MTSSCHFFLLFCVFVFSSPKVTLEAEVTNKGALALYGRLGFIRAKRLFHYYLNGVDAFRLKLLFPQPELYPSLPMMADRDDTHEHDDC